MPRETSKFARYLLSRYLATSCALLQEAQPLVERLPGDFVFTD